MHKYAHALLTQNTEKYVIFYELSIIRYPFGRCLSRFAGEDTGEDGSRREAGLLSDLLEFHLRVLMH